MSEPTTPPPKPIPKAPTYAWVVPNLTSVARRHGYALGLHGSMNRDLDLMAMPWTDEADAPEVLIEAMREAVDGYIVPDGTEGGRYCPETKGFVKAIVRNPCPKPHGRLAWNIHFSGSKFYLDVSVMPPTKKN